MNALNLAEAKAQFSALIHRVEAGESVEITRRGRPVARVVPIEHPKEPIDIRAMAAVAATIPYQSQSAGEFIRAMRDSDRY